MKCSEIKPVLSDYLADALEGDARLCVEGHLQGCADCSKELARMRGMIAGLGRIDRVSAPPGFLDGVLRKAERNKTAYARWLRIPFAPPKIKIPLQLTAMAVLCIFVLHIVPQRTDRTDAPYVETQPSPPLPAAKKEALQTADSTKERRAAESEKRVAVSPMSEPASDEMRDRAERDNAERSAAGVPAVFETTVFLHVASAAFESAGSSDAGQMPGEAPKPPPSPARTFSATPPRRASEILSISPGEKAPQSAADTSAGEERIRFEPEKTSIEESARESGKVLSRVDQKAEGFAPRDISRPERIRDEVVKLADLYGGVPAFESSPDSEGTTLKIGILSENFKKFMERLASLGVVEASRTPLPEESFEAILVEICIVYP